MRRYFPNGVGWAGVPGLSFSEEVSITTAPTCPENLTTFGGAAA
jgi:hypothetical protein